MSYRERTNTMRGCWWIVRRSLTLLAHTLGITPDRPRLAFNQNKIHVSVERRKLVTIEKMLGTGGHNAKEKNSGFIRCAVALNKHQRLGDRSIALHPYLSLESSCYPACRQA